MAVRSRGGRGHGSCLPVKAWVQRQAKKKGKKKGLSILEAKLGRCVYHLWHKQVPFDVKRFLGGHG